MADKTKQLLILNFLKTQRETLSLREIQEQCGVPCAERSLRRWLNNWEEQALITRTGQKRSSRYQYIVNKAIHPGFLANVPEAKRELALKQLRDLWTHNSNAIEGNTLSLGDTHFILEEGLTVSGKPLREHLEVIGHARAINLLYKAIDKALTEDIILDLHKAVQTDIVIDIYKPYGAWKVEKNGTYVVTREQKQAYIEYAPPSHVPLLMKQLIDAINTLAKSSEHTAAKHYAYIHTAFVHIHPFFDGNGRLARLIANLALLKSGLPPLLINVTQRQSYIQILADYEIKSGQLTNTTGLWPKQELLKEFEVFCQEQYKATIDLLEELKHN